MFLPYASDFKPTKSPVMTTGLIGVLTALTALYVFGDRIGPTWGGAALLYRFGIVPAHFEIASLITYLFFHEGFGHLLVNLFYLTTFGAGAEAALGRLRFVILFLASGVIGGALQWLVVDNALAPGQGNTPIVGASAGCAGIIGLFAVRYYRASLDFTFLKYRPHVVYVVAAFLVFEGVSGSYNLLTGALSAGVAHWAHIGGFLFGLGYAQVVNLGETGSRAYLGEDAKKSYDRNVPGDAIKSLEVLLAREPNNAFAQSEMARAWLLLGDTEQAQSHFQQAITAYLAQNKRSEAALLYAEMRDAGRDKGIEARDGELSSAQLFVIGGALEELEQTALAADTLRAVTIRSPDSPEAETALLKVISLYVHRLNRREEANVLLRLFKEKYPHSAWRSLAEDLRRAAEEESTNQYERRI